ncbi:MAG TPA: hypothetical protein ENJ80_09715 [Gammaproteobacteria bacterium]|nr:hypothetical protein [Gammaproteobacteria bacterium]
MRKLLESLGLSPGEDLDDWMALAQTIQDKRGADKKVRVSSITRSTALYAAAALNSDVYNTLQSLGLDWQGYRESIGIGKTPPVSGAPLSDVKLHRHFEMALQQSSSRFSEVRALDTRGVALFIIGFVDVNPDLGALPKRLHGLGLDIGRAVDELLKLAQRGATTDSSGDQATSTSPQKSPGTPTPRTGIWIFRADIEQFSLEENLFPKKVDRWRMAHNPGFVVGDLIWFWQGGDTDARGLYGWGRVNEAPDDETIPVLYEERFEPYWSAEQLAGYELDLPVLTADPRQTFLPISAGQSEQLESVLRELNLVNLPSGPGVRPDDGSAPAVNAAYEEMDSAGNTLRKDDLASHVQTALLWAVRNDLVSKKTGQISAEGALRGVLNTAASSRAFESIREALTSMGAEIETPSFDENNDQVSFAISPALAESLAISTSAIPDRKNVWGRALITAILFAPERVFPSFARNPQSLGAQWRTRLQDVWWRFLVDNDSEYARNWEVAINDLRGLYQRFGETDPAYFANQLNPQEPGGGPPTDSPVAAPRAWVETDSVPVIGQENGARHSERDSLNAKDQAELFATLLIAKDVQPPFAIGLLGDWGVGKTFFMRLMQEKVAAIAGKKAQAEASADSVSRAAQIEFNAWHYVDSDLWASLASHLFDGLSVELRGRNDTVDGVRRELRKKIRSSEQEQKVARAVIAEAQKSRKIATRKLAIRRSKRDCLRKYYEERRLKRVWDAVRKVKPEPGDPEKKDWPDLEDARKKAEAAARDLGLTETIDTAESAQQVYEQLRDIKTRGSALSNAIAAAFTGSRAWASGLLLLALLAVVLAWPWLLEQLIVGEEFSFSAALSPLLQFVTILGTGLTWVSKRLKQVSSGLGYLEAIQEEMQNPRLKLERPSPEEARLHEHLQDLDVKIVTEEHRLDEADRQIAEAQAEIQRINSGGLVYDFLEGRVRDSRYLDRLGLISVIRQDFEQLAELLKDWRTHGSQDTEEEQKGSDSEESWDTRPIERIILYIDDLDRCPPERVVEVLQAVHLILAFELFVVVVAVDPRWLERSLNEEYNAQHPTLGDRPLQDRQYRFSAQNYLEKIFQIPFSLPVMDVGGYRKLIAGMTNQPRTRFERVQAADGEEVKPKPDREPEPVPQHPVNPARTEVPAETPGQTTSTTDTSSLDADLVREQKAGKRKQEQEEARERIAAMLLREWEEQFIAALHPFLSTPRLAKRFINIYRLLRVQAASDDEQFARFIDSENGEYRVVLILLAISVGRADTGSQIISDFSSIAPETAELSKWLPIAAKKYKEDWRSLFVERSEQNKQSSLSVPPSNREEQLEKLSNAAAEIHRSLGTVIRQLGENGGPKFEDDFELCRKWSCDVGRYSFGWHLTTGE